MSIITEMVIGISYLVIFGIAGALAIFWWTED